jgi:Xaa-Pro aminopeptidase
MVLSPPAEISARVAALQSKLRELDIDLAILSENSDLYYYSGSIQPLYLLVPAAGTPVALARKALTRIQTEVMGSAIEAFHGTKDLAAIIEKHGLGKAKRIAFTLDTVSYASVDRFLKLIVGAEAVDIAWTIRTLRMIKSENELSRVRESARILSGLPDLVKSVFRPGMTELELSAPIEHYFRQSGHGAIIRCRREGVDMSSSGVLSSGANSLEGTKFDGICVGKGLSPGAPYGSSTERIEPGVPIIMDYAVTIDGYHSDQTRMASWGAPSHEVMRAYEAMRRIETAISVKLRSGAICEDLYSESLRMAEELGYADTFMGIGTERVRFVGHGVGLEMDEPPYLAPKMKYPLEGGMTVAIEPKVALPGIGVIGIEDTFEITSGEPTLLTACSPEFIILG